MFDVATPIYENDLSANSAFAITLSRTIKTRSGWAQHSLSPPDLIALLSEHREYEQKDEAPVFFPGSLSNGVRDNGSVQDIGLLVFDIDDGRRIQEVFRKVQQEGILACAYSTFSHSADHPKYRLVFPLASPFVVDRSTEEAAQRSQATWRAAYAKAAERFGIDFDKSCSDLSRAYYLPSCKTGSERSSQVFDGRLLQISDFIDSDADPVSIELGQRPSTRQLKKWLAAYGSSFEIETALRRSAPPAVFRSPRPGKGGVHIRCPFEDTHSETGGQGAFVVNASENEGRGLGLHCCHNHCLTDRGNGTRVDRVPFLEEMLKLGWLTWADMQNETLGGGSLKALSYDMPDILVDASGYGLDISKFDQGVIKRKLLGFRKLDKLTGRTVDPSRAAEGIAHLIGEGFLGVKQLRECVLDEVSHSQGPQSYESAVYAAAKSASSEDTTQKDLDDELAIIASRFKVKLGTVKADMTAMMTKHPILKSESIGILDPLVLKNETSVRAFRKDYARLLQGGKFYILDVNRCGISDALIDVDAFKQHHADKSFDYYEKQGRNVTFRPADVFVDQPPPGTMTYDKGLVFKPDNSHGSGEFNLFKGFNLDPDPSGNYSLLMDLFREVWCRDDPEGVEYLKEWFMHILARPADKIRTALVVRGRQGDGKSIVFDQLMKPLLGDMVLKTTNSNIVLGNFNEPLQGKLLMVFEEAAFAGDKKKFEELKELITGDRITINAKFKAPVEMDNFARVALITNSDHAAHIKPDDRRYTVFETASSWQGSNKHLQLVEQLQQGGAARFLHDALNHSFRRISGTSALVINRPYQTKAKTQQIALSRSPLEEFVVHALLTGEFDDRGQGFIDSSPLIAWHLDQKLDISSQGLLKHAQAFADRKSGFGRAGVTLNTVMQHLVKFCGRVGSIRPKITNSTTGFRTTGATMRRLPPRRDALKHALDHNLITDEEYQSSVGEPVDVENGPHLFDDL